MSIADKLTQIAENIPKVYDRGVKDEWHKLWNDIQDYGRRTAYNNGFQNAWTDASFKPKCDMRPTSAGYMFAGTKIANLKKCLEDSGVVLDTSNATSVDRLFSDAQNLTYVPTISTVNAPHLQNFVYNCKKLISVDMVILKDDGSQTFNDNSFKNCESLVEIRFSGVIGNNVNFSWSENLSAESYNNIINHLSPTASEKTITVPSVAPDVYDAKYGAGAWQIDVRDNPNIKGWTFAYVQRGV